MKGFTVCILCVGSFILGCTITVNILILRDEASRKLPEQPNSETQVSQQISQTLLYILVLSSPTNEIKRKTIRDTWLSLLDVNIHKVYFVIGIKTVSSSIAAKLYEENLKHKDLMLLSELDDEYHTLTEKVLYGFKTINKSNFKYVLKCDDDSYVNIKHMTNEINKNEAQSLYWGYFRGDAKVKTQGQWKEEEWNICDNYLPYAHGGGYVLTKDLVSFIVNNMDHWRLFNSEDVSLGAWLAAVKTTRRHDTRFNTEYRSRGCLNSYLVMHKQSTEDMKDLHKNLIRKGKMCGIERQFIPSFEYNWNVLPSKCCVRQKLTLT